MEIGNLNKDTNYNISCIVCGETNNLHMKAHRREGRITGFIFSCESCDLKDTQFGIWDGKTGEAKI